MKSINSGIASSRAAKHRLVLAFVGLLAWVLPSPLQACGIYYHGEEYRVSLLSPWLAGEEYAPFFYSAYLLYEAPISGSGHDRRRNCNEWAAYMGGTVDPAHVQAVLYGSSLQDLNNALSGDAQSPLAANAFWKALRQPARKAVLDYVLLAKQYEMYASGSLKADPWGEYSYDYMSFQEQLEEVAQRAKQGLADTQDAFLRKRYAYQNLVMARYKDDKARFKSLWDQHFASEANGGSILYDWALHHKAAMVTNEAERSYLYALSFMRCPEKRLYSYGQFDPKLATRALGMAKTPEEKAHVLAMAALKNPGRALDLISRVQSTFPQHPLLRLLVIREINKLEDWLLTMPVTGLLPAYHPSNNQMDEYYGEGNDWMQYRLINRQKDEAYLAELLGFVQKLPATASLPISMKQLLIGHLLMLRKDVAGAQAAWQGLSARSGKAIATQLSKDQLLLLLNEKDLSQPDVQQQMQSLLYRWKNSFEGRPEEMRDWQVVCKMISQQYEQQNQLAEAFLLNNHSLNLPTDETYNYHSPFYGLLGFLDWRADEKAIDQVLALMDKPKKTAWENFLLKAPRPTREALLDLRGTISFRKNHLEEALKAFQQIDPSFWREHYEYRNHLKNDPFVARAFTKPPFKPFPESKVALIQQLMELEKQLNGPADQVPAAELKLGIAWLNFSHYGNSWMMFSYGWSMYDVNTYPNRRYLPADEKLSGVYLRMTKAESHLQQALAKATDKETKATASYLLAHINELRALSTADAPQYWEEGYKAHLQKILQVYEPWRRDYDRTKTFQTVMLVCPELAQYFGLATGKK